MTTEEKLRTVVCRVTNAQSGEPIFGAKVELIVSLWHSEERREIDERIYTATTGADGAYAFEVVSWVDMGPVRLRCAALISAPGHSPEMANLNIPPLDRAEIRFNFVLRTGLVLKGVVRDEEGQPLAGVEVALMESSSIGCSGARCNSISEVTDAAGHFEAEGVPIPSACEVQIVLGLFHPRYERRFVHRLERLATPGGEARVEVTLPRGMSLAGVVRDAAGHPVEGADVFVAAELYYACDPACSRPPAQFGIKSGADGRFAAHGLPKHRYWIIAQQGSLHGGAKVSLLESSRDDLEIQLNQGVSLGGRVLDPSGSPAIGVEIEVTQNHGLLDLERTLHSDASGRYHVDGLLAGLDTYLSAPGGARHALPPSLNADLQLEPLGRVVGRIMGPNGHPHVAEEVRLTRHNAVFGHGLKAALSSDGRFELQSVQAGNWYLFVRPGPGSGAVSTFTPLVITAGDSDLGDIVLDEGATFSGTVVDPAGAPVEGAELHLDSLAYYEGVATRTDSRGHFRLSRLVNGSYQIRVSSTRFAVHHELDVNIVGLTSHDIRLRKPGSLLGRVMDGDRPVDGQGLSIHRPSAMTPESTRDARDAERRIRIDDTTTDATGHYKFAFVAQGRWAIRCGLSEQIVEVTESQETRCDFSWPGVGEGFDWP